jgi:ATP-dependent Clp protease ATP-binding subunit ClpA
MNLNKFTEKAQEAILASQQLAESHHHSQMNVEHLLIALSRTVIRSSSMRKATMLYSARPKYPLQMKNNESAVLEV